MLSAKAQEAAEQARKPFKNPARTARERSADPPVSPPAGDGDAADEPARALPATEDQPVAPTPTGAPFAPL